MYLLVEKTMQKKLTNCISVTLKFSNLLLVFSSALHFLQRALIYRNKIGLITHARSGMSLNLPAVFLFIIIIIIIIIFFFFVSRLCTSGSWLWRRFSLGQHSTYLTSGFLGMT